jgi:integrase
MAQNDFVAIPAARYTRADFTALRAHLNKIPLERIADLYYTEDALTDLGIASAADLRSRIETLRDTIIARATVENPHIAEMLRSARQTQRWSRALIDHLFHVAEQDASKPKRTDPVSAWLKPRVASVLKSEGVATIASLIDLIETRGAGWWKPVPRIGAMKASAIVGWLQENEAALGSVDIFEDDLAPANELVVLDPYVRQMVPLDRATVPDLLSGSCGANRNQTFPLISARNDLEAIEAYLYKYRGQEKTRRAYQKELERFLLWCIYECRMPMSSALVGECEAYKDFLANPASEWIGRKTIRMSKDWRPFSGKLSPASQRYAVAAVRSFFEWLVRVRYLAGNPWVAVADPRVAQQINAIQIEKALPADLWGKLIVALDVLCSVSDSDLHARFKLRGAAAKMKLAAQFRLVRAALLLLGDSGLRREEAATALRSRLKPVPGTPDLWELDVLGKRNKWRTVFLPLRVVDAIEAHWRDRGKEFDFGMVETPLLAPVTLPRTRASDEKFGDGQIAGFTPDGLYGAIKSVLSRIANDYAINELNERERDILRTAGPHAFRHTFGTQAAAGNVPLDVLQRVLGHASLQTTTIYVQAEKKRSIDELGEFFRGRK